MKKNQKVYYLEVTLKEDFSKLDLINNENFFGEKDNLDKNFISIGKELSFNLRFGNR